MKLADKLAKAAGKMSPRKLILLCAFFALMIFIILYSTLSSFEGKKEEKTPEVAASPSSKRRWISRRVRSSRMIC